MSPGFEDFPIIKVLRHYLEMRPHMIIRKMHQIYFIIEENLIFSYFFFIRNVLGQNFCYELKKKKKSNIQ